VNIKKEPLNIYIYYIILIGFQFVLARLNMLQKRGKNGNYAKLSTQIGRMGESGACMCAKMLKP
jgi:hypothetical protein